MEIMKVAFRIKEKFGITAKDLRMAEKKYNLSENKELLSFQKLAQAQMASESQKETQRATPSKEAIEKTLEKARKLGAPQIKNDGSLTYDYFISIQSVLFVLVFTHSIPIIEDFKM